MRAQKRLYAVELDISQEAGRPDYWVIHNESEDWAPGLCVYETKKEALEAAKGRDHKSRIVTFERVETVTKRGKK
jgi:hypothetical protein